MIQSEADIPDLLGKVALVTGATGGLGLETARMLAGAGAHVILTGRNEDKGLAALRTIAPSKPRGHIEFESLDVADLAAIAASAARIMATHDRLDILVNNAGLMMPKERKTTADGFEIQFGTNHLGHFALTGRLLPLLSRSKARVISVSSLAARAGRMDFDDLQSEKHYRPMAVYGQSKLANLLFTRELARRSAQNGWNILAAAAHPGWSRTDLIDNGPGRGGISNVFYKLFEPIASQPADAGALPSVVAATDREIRPNDYIGPDSFGGAKGKPKRVDPPKQAQDDDAARRLWEVSEKLTGVHYAV
jgi:NAD(P)-dependent dehydrogenase (short-subunit alcohol dehydrogenase family)